ncbi:MAG: hypothetical protein IJI74_05880 [Firmicutes bacterium]|nr:hypothetical protein [Bacillota bacterium]
MNFADYEDNRKLIDRLEQSVQDGRISHAYLFEGPETVDKLAFAKSFIKGVLCPPGRSPAGRGENCGRCELCDKIDHDNHEDIIYIQKDGKSVKDEAIIAMQERLKVKPLEGKNIAVICDSDQMTARAQNRLLKTLEEPLGKAMIILLSENMENLTSTILSRCVKFRINGSSEPAEGKKAANIRAKAEEIVGLCLKKAPYYQIRGKLNARKLTDDDASMLLDEMERVYRNIIIDNDKNDVPLYDLDRLYDRIYAIEETRKELRLHVSITYALQNLILKIGG